MQQPEHEPPISGEIYQSGEIQQSPKNIERGEGVKTTSSTVQPSSNQVAQDFNQQTQKQQASDDPQEEVVEVVIPDQPQTYADWKKGPPESSKTWLSAFWDRVVKRAKHMGWHVLVKQNK